MRFVQLFLEKKMRKTETKLPDADGSLVSLTMFCWLIKPNPSSIGTNWIQPAFLQIQNLISVRLSS